MANRIVILLAALVWLGIMAALSQRVTQMPVPGLVVGVAGLGVAWWWARRL